jgi:MFS family permease
VNGGFSGRLPFSTVTLTGRIRQGSGHSTPLCCRAVEAPVVDVEARRLSGRYWRLWSASTISNLGDGIAIVALPLLAVSLTRNPVLVSLLGFVQYLPWLLFSLISGALVDRLDRRVLMWRTDVFRAVVISAVGLLVAVDWMNLPVLFTAAFLLGTAETLFDNASQAILPSLVDRDDLAKANGRLQGAEVVTNQFVGPPLGGLLFAAAAATPFLLDGASFLAAAVLVALIPGSFRPERAAVASDTPVVRQVRDDIAEGLRWLWRHRVLRTLAMVLGGANLFWWAGESVLVLFAQDILGLDEAGYGVLLTSFAAGSVAASVTADRLIVRLGSGTVLIASLVAMGVSPLIAGLLSSPWLVGVMFVVMGFSTVVWNIITVSLRQSIIPDEILGRVNSAYRFVGWGVIPLGALLGGVLADVFGLRAPFIVGGAGMIVLAVVMAPIVNTRTIQEAQQR